jgi:hypothetical protein
MADVPIYVAIITALAGLAGATIPQFTILRRDARNAERERQERKDEARRQACLDLLRVAGELRTQVANNFEYHGTEMAERLGKVRQAASEARLHAVEVSLRAPDRLAEPAEEVAAAAENLAVAAAENTDVNAGVMRNLPGFSALDVSIEDFRREVIAEAGGQAGDASRPARPAIGG